MVQEGGILFGVEHLKKSTGGVTIDPLTDLVDLINEDQRVLDSDALECLNNLPGQSSVNS